VPARQTAFLARFHIALFASLSKVLGVVILGKHTPTPPIVRQIIERNARDECRRWRPPIRQVGASLLRPLAVIGVKRRA
jgi:hypothetical protein